MWPGYGFGEEDSLLLPTVSVSELHQTHSYLQYTSFPDPLAAIAKCTLPVPATALPTFSKKSLPVAGTGERIQPCGLPSCIEQLLSLSSKEAAVNQIKALHRPRAEPHSPRSIPRALAPILGMKLLRKLIFHSPAPCFATNTCWRQSHLAPSFPAPLHTPEQQMLMACRDKSTSHICFLPNLFFPASVNPFVSHYSKLHIPTPATDSYIARMKLLQGLLLMC